MPTPPPTLESILDLPFAHVRFAQQRLGGLHHATRLIAGMAVNEAFLLPQPRECLDPLRTLPAIDALGARLISDGFLRLQLSRTTAYILLPPLPSLLPAPVFGYVRGLFLFVDGRCVPV